MKKQNKATKQKAKKSTNAKTGSAVSKPAKKKSKSTSQRYSAKLVNGKGYIFDKKFSEKVPIAVETTMEFAEKQVEKFNKEEKSAGKNSTKKTAVTKKKETAAAKPAAPKPAAKTEEKSTSINTSATKERRGIQNFLEVKSVLKSGTARNIAFKKTMTFYAEHSVDEAIKLLKDEAKARQAAEKGTSKTTRAVSSKKIVAKQQSKPAVINMPTTAVNAALAEAKTKELLKDRKKRLVNELVAQGADRKVASAMVDAFRTSGVEHMITATTKQSNKKTVATTAAAQPAPTAEQPAAKRRVYKNMPNNYSIVKGSVAQEDGTILIHNGKPLFKQNKDGVKEQVKDSRGKPAHKVAALIVDPQAFNEAQKKSRVGEIHRGNTKYIDKEPKPQRNYAVVKDKDGKVTVAKVKSIKEFDENGKNADPHLVEIDHKKYGLENRSGVDHETFSQNKMSHKPLRLEDKKVFPEQEPRAKLSSKDTHRVLEHIKQNKKKK